MSAPLSRRDVLAGALALGSFRLVSAQGRAITQAPAKLVANEPGGYMFVRVRRSSVLQPWRRMGLK